MSSRGRRVQKQKKGSWLFRICLIVILAGGFAVGWIAAGIGNKPAPEVGAPPEERAEFIADLSAEESSPPEEPEPEESQAEEFQPEESQPETSAPREVTAGESASQARAKEVLDSMTLTEKIYQMFLVTQEQLTGFSPVTKSGETTREAIETHPVGGIVYFEPNLVAPEQCTEMINNIQSYSKLGLFIAVDEEGGTVARLGNNPEMRTTVFPDMGEIGSTSDPDRAYEVGHTIGTELKQYGFNLDFAPVADVNSNPDNPVIGQRSFSSDPETASEMVAAAVKGFRDSGTLCTLKHFPGHGDTSTDSHLGYSEVTKNLDQLKEVEFPPFAAGVEAGAECVMVGHLSVPEVTGDDVPATLSGTMIDLLREEIGFDGLVITDSMSMGAITDRYASDEAAVKAVQAGIDVILMPEDLQAAAEGIQQAVENGTITEERIDQSVLKILETKLDSGIIPME